MSKVEPVRRRREAYLVFVVVLPLAAMIAAASLAAQAGSEKKRIQQQLAALWARLAVIDPAAEEEYRKHLEELQLHGVIGEESRLSLVENVRRAARGASLHDMSYELGPQKPLNTLFPGGSESVEASAMTIHLRPRQSDQVSVFFKKLHAQGHGLYWARRCTQRMALNGARPATEAECELLWITVKSPLS